MIAFRHGWWIFPFFWLGWFVILALVFGGRWFWWRRYRGGTDRNGSGEQVLSERYARGEIDEDEYRRRLGVLREHGR